MKKYTKKYGLLCTECNTLTISEASIEFPKNLSLDAYYNLSGDYYCSRCKDYTYHIDLDSRIAKCIRTLRLHDYETIYSCAGHMRYTKNDSGDIKEYTVHFPYIAVRVKKGDHTLIDKLSKFKVGESTGYTITPPENTNGWYITVDPEFTDKACTEISDKNEHICLRYKSKATDELKKFALDKINDGTKVAEELLTYIKDDFKDACDQLYDYLLEALL